MSQIGPYEIQQKLGEGAMGQVYLGWHPLLKQHHAIKVMSGQFTRADLARFQRELEIVAAIKHPNIISIHSAGLQGTRQPYYAMDFVKGVDLESRIKEGSFEEDKAAKIICKLALALAEFHDQGVLHRDIKPANILLAAGDEPKLADFGLAKNDTGQQLTRTGEIVGTPIYMSPEQATGQTLDLKSDLYSLGAILFEMLAGHPMVMGKTTPEVLHKVSRGEVYTLDAFRPDASSRLDAIIKRATHFQKAKRYNDARELAADLKAFLSADSPAPAISENRRFRRLLWLPLGVLVISGFGIGAVSWFQRQEQKTADDKHTQAFAKQVQRLSPRSDNEEILRIYGLKDRFWNANDSSKSAKRVFGILELWRARVALRSHDAKTAAKNVENAQKLLPRSDPHLLGIQAGLAIESQEYSLEKAEKFINKALSKRKNDGEFHAWAARIYYSQGKTHVAASEADLARIGGFPVPTVEALLALKKKNYARVIRYIDEEDAKICKEDYESALSGAAKRATADRRFEVATDYVAKLYALNPRHITLRTISQKLVRGSESQLSDLNDVIKKNPRNKLDEIATMGSRLEKSFRLARIANPDMDIGQKVRKSIESASIILTKRVETY
ncbi:MAG: serine/threonine-protein kinase, partial [Planctomycetota bacterium]|nr:serine/threonine-protein kinase [Planctomycetota bacterium]